MNVVEERGEANQNEENEDNASLVVSEHSVEEGVQEINLGVAPENIGIDPGSASEYSASDSEQEDDEPDQNIDDQPLYDGAQITFRQSLLSILSFALKHKLTGACISDLLSLLHLHCADNSIALKTLYQFKKYFNMIGRDHVNCNYYCSVCQVALASKDTVCEQCNGQHPAEYFLGFPLVSQLQSMYMRPGFREDLQFKTNRVKKNLDNIEDIYDAAIYQEQVENGFLSNPDNISFFMYFYGVSIF
ncbi:hypothetical protein ONE63_000025 [Megalurothrips usitatus]|uniref:Uncharacterized protein n=1 Tax=Megalurothrips usitatus TaxID=439358 RepID=A0AAV7XX73_9NEOP|nr:hypothetical protein ONE63_000025 [Megalurothrips usitatus]